MRMVHDRFVGCGIPNSAVRCDISVIENALRTAPMIALFFLGLAAAAVGPALTILLDREGSTGPTGHADSAGMFAAVNDNATALATRAA